MMGLPETLSIEGKSYITNDLSEKAQYLVSQLMKLNARIADASADIEVLQIALDKYRITLLEEVEQELEEVPEEQETQEI